MCQSLVFLDEEVVVTIACRHVLQYLSQSGQYPPVATCPEVLKTVGTLMLRIDIFAVTEVEPCLLVEHDAIGK